MKQSLNYQLAKALGALILAIASLAVLAPALNVSASREASQQPQPFQDKQTVPAAMQPIRPVAVATVNVGELAQAEKKRGPSAIKSESEPLEIHAPMTIPEPDVPLSSYESTKPQVEIPQPADSGGALIGSPAPASSFVAQLDEPKVGTSTRTIPPDTTGAVGATRIFSTLNTNYRIQNKADGATLSTVSIDAFWAPLNSATPGPSPSPTPAPVAGVFDPRIQYDPYTGGGRWIVAAVSNSRSASASVLVGISATSDPQGTFTLYRFVVGCAAGAVGCDASGEWADFPMLGFNKNWIAVGWNQFRTAGSGSFVAGKILILDYPALQTGTANSSIVTNTVSGTNFCMHPATTYSATEETLYIPVHRSSGGAAYHLHKITGTPSAPVLNLDPDTNFKIRPGGGWTQPSGDILPQTCIGTIGLTCPAAARKIDSGDSFIRSNVVFRNGNIWYAQTIGLPAPAGGVMTHTAAQWTRIDPSGAFIEGGRIDDPNATATNGEWYAYPSIAVNANGDVLLGFSNFGWTHYARAAYAMRLNGEGSMRDPAMIKDGEDYYSKSFTGTRNRWGDYSHTMVDPDNDVDFWTIQEYAGTRTVADALQTTSNSRWGTWWAKITPSGPPADPLPTPAPCATALVVSDSGDAGDATIGDGVCATATGACTLRAAVDEANARVYCGPVFITFSVTGQISLVSDQLFLAHNINVIGPGASQLTIRRSTAAGTPNFRVLQVLSGGVASISGLTISGGNVSGSGGGIASAGTLTLTNVAIDGNSATGTAHGGGMFVFGGSVTMNSSSINGNSAVDGGGIYIDSGTVTLAQSTVAGNNANFGIGGGIVNSGGVLLVVNSTLSGNSAGTAGGQNGGAIYTTGSSGVSATIINSTISGNRAAGGGGITTFGPVTLTNSTVAGNTASNGNGGGILVQNPTAVTMKNTIVAANTLAAGGAGPDLSGTFASQDYNLIGNTSGVTFTGTTTHNVTNINPLLGPLANNGGPTLTHALLACSPALNAGGNALALDQNGSPLLTDQRGAGFNRISNGTVDMGAFELQAAAPTLFVEGSDLTAVDSVTLVRGPFALTDNHNFSAEKRTRILFFVTDLGFSQLSQPDINTLSVQIGGNSYPVEAVGPNSTVCGSYVVFRLPDLAPNTYQLGIRVRGVNSTNTANLTIVAPPSGPAAAAKANKTKLMKYLLVPIVDLLL